MRFGWISDSDSATAGDLDTRFWHPDSLLLLVLLQRDAAPSMLRCLSCRLLLLLLLLLLLMFPFLLLLELLLLPGAVSAQPHGCDATAGPAAFGPAGC